MKIDGINYRRENFSQIQDRALAMPADGNSAISFEDALHGSHYKVVSEQLAEIIADIDEQGRRLSKNRRLEDLVHYKRAVARFLDIAMENMFELKRDTSFDRWGGHNIHTIAKLVDEKLGELTRKILDKEQDRIDIVSIIDDIRGLLMDVFT